MTVATRNDIIRWFAQGETMPGVTHLIVAWDDFDHSSYPVYVKRGESVQEEVRELQGKAMSSVDEVYSYALDFHEQLAEKVSWHDEEVGP